MISLTQINISEPKVRVARLFFNSTMPLFLQFKAAIKKKKILISYLPQENKGSLSIFNIFYSNQYLTFFFSFTFIPLPERWHVLFLLSLSLNLNDQEVVFTLLAKTATFSLQIKREREKE